MHHPKGKNDKPKDTKLFEKMTNSTPKLQYILKWLVQGSMKFYLNGGDLLPSPPCCEKYKDEYIKANDYCSFFEITDNRKDFMTYQEITDEINDKITRQLMKAKVYDELIELGAKKSRPVINGTRKKGLSYIKTKQEYVEFHQQEFNGNVIDSSDDEES